MGMFDRLRKRSSPASSDRWDGVAPHPDEYPRWAGGTVDWAALGVPEDRLDLAAEIAASTDFGVDPPQEPGFDWDLALFDDVRGIVGDDAIEALPAWLMDTEAVEEAVHADREYIWVRGPVDRHDLALRVVARLAITGDPAYWDDPPEG